MGATVYITHIMRTPHSDKGPLWEFSFWAEYLPPGWVDPDMVMAWNVHLSES